MSFHVFEPTTKGYVQFKVFVTPSALVGGWIAPCDFEEMLARFGGSGLVNNNQIQGVQTAARNAVQWEARYDEISPDSPEFLAQHGENFRIEASQIQEAKVKWNLGALERASTRFGRLDLKFTNGKKRRFYLIGRAQPSEIVATLQKLLPQLQIEGASPAGDAFAPSQGQLAQNAGVTAAPIAKKVSLLTYAAWILAWIGGLFLGLVIADATNNWIPLVVVCIAPWCYKMYRQLHFLLNYSQNNAEQLRRNRAEQNVESGR